MKTRVALPALFLVLASVYSTAQSASGGQRSTSAAQSTSPGGSTSAAQSIDLPTSKQLIDEIPGHPQRLNSLPISMAVSPDKRYVVTVNAGYGTFESQYNQSLAVLDTQTGSVADFPDPRTEARSAKQTLYSGLAFSG